MKPKFIKTIFGALEVSPYCDAEKIQQEYDSKMKAYGAEIHSFRHQAESGNVFIGFATLFRDKATKQFDSQIGWASKSLKTSTIADVMERDLLWIPEVGTILERITGRPLDFKPNKKQNL